MNQDTKEYFECMLDENSSFTKTDYRDALGQLLYSAEHNHKRAEAWKDVFNKMMDCESAHPKRKADNALALAVALKKARILE